MIYRVYYLSTATKDLSVDELEELLSKSRNNNSKYGITGLLIVKGRTFLQCIEGKKENVLELYKNILQDDRHKNILELLSQEDDKRMFPNWDMGYKNVQNLTSIQSEYLKKFDYDNIDEIPALFKRFIEIY